MSGRCVKLSLTSATDVELLKVKYGAPGTHLKTELFSVKFSSLETMQSKVGALLLWIPAPFSALSWYSSQTMTIFILFGLSPSLEYKFHKVRAIV